MKKVMLILFAMTTLAGCQNRVLWDSNGQLNEATQNREVWNSNGKMDAGERKIWVNKEGEDVIR